MDTPAGLTDQDGSHNLDLTQGAASDCIVTAKLVAGLKLLGAIEVLVCRDAVCGVSD